MEDKETKTQEISDSGGQGQPSESQKEGSGEPKVQEQPDITQKTLGEIFGDNLPPALQNFKDKPITELGRAKEEAERFLTKLTQGYTPSNVDIQTAQEWTGTPQMPMGQQEETETEEVEEEKEEIDPVLEPEKFKQKLLEEAKKEVEKEFIPLLQTIGKAQIEQTYSSVKQTIPDFEKYEDEISKILQEGVGRLPLQEQIVALSNPQTYIDAYGIAKVRKQLKEGMQTVSSGGGFQTVSPTPTAKPSPSTGGTEEPTEIELPPDAERMLRYFYRNNPEKIKEIKEELKKELLGGKK